MDSYKWVQSSAYSSIPPNAIIGGNDLDASVIYVGRAYHNGDTLVAKVVPSKHIAFVTYQGAEIPKEHFEVLCGTNLVWEHCYHHVVPENAVLCGETSLGQPIYIGRGHYNGSLAVGKISSVHRALFIPYAGGEKRLESYEILVEEKGPIPGWAIKTPLEEKKFETDLDAKPFPSPPPPLIAMPMPFTESFSPPEPPPPYTTTSYPPAAAAPTPELQPERKVFYTPTDQPPPRDVKPLLIAYGPSSSVATPATNYVPGPQSYAPAENYKPGLPFSYTPADQHKPGLPFSYTPADQHKPGLPLSYTPAEYKPGSHSYAPAETYIPPVQSFTPADSYVPPAGIRGDLWVNASSSYIPPNAFTGGHDINLTPFYICRAYHDGHMLPGKASPSHGCAFVCCDGQEIRKHNFDVLIGERYHWVSAYNGHMPHGAVEGGRDANGEVLYVGRAHHYGSLTPGKIHPSHRCIYIPFGGREVRLQNYEALVSSDYAY